MAEKINVPAIRFAGFVDPWEQRKLGDFGSVAMCKRIYKEQTSEQGDIPFFKIGTFGADPDAFISNELFEDFRHTYPYPAPGTLLISAAGSIGRVVEYQGEKAYFQDSNIVWLEHDHRLNDAFLKPLYSQIEWGLEGSTIKRLYNKDLVSAEVTIPDDREQKVIGQFFAKLDNLITLHQRKFEKLVQLKKSMLDKMFPKPGERFPEIRFAGFTDPWEQRKLGELLLFQNGFNGSSESFGSGIPLISVMDVLDDEFITHETVRGKARLNYEEASRYCVEYGDVLFQRSSENQEDAGTSNVYLDQHVPSAFGGFVIRGKKVGEYNPIFIKYLLGSSLIREQITHRAQGAQHINVSQDTLADVVLLMPSMREQEAVGLVFLHLANLITLHQRKLELLRNTKKSLLDRMFV